MVDGDAVQKYVLSLPPKARLEYYVLSRKDRDVLRAMLSFNRTGAEIFPAVPTLAEEAELSVKTVQRSINGYKREDGKKVPGLRDRGILLELAPARGGKNPRAASYRINWEAFTVNPAKVGEIERRLQKTLPGIKEKPMPHQHELASESQSGNAVKIEKPDVILTSPRRQNDFYRRQFVQQPGVSLTPESENLNLALNLSNSNIDSAGSDRGAVEIQPASSEKAGARRLSKIGFSNPKTRTRATFATLHPALKAKIDRELKLVIEAQTGVNTFYWTAEAIAKWSASNMRRACERAGIWPHVTDDLVEQTYEINLSIERAKKQEN